MVYSEKLAREEKEDGSHAWERVAVEVSEKVDGQVLIEGPLCFAKGGEGTIAKRMGLNRPIGRQPTSFAFTCGPSGEIEVVVGPSAVLLATFGFRAKLGLV